MCYRHSGKKQQNNMHEYWIWSCTIYHVYLLAMECHLLISIYEWYVTFQIILPQSIQTTSGPVLVILITFNQSLVETNNLWSLLQEPYEGSCQSINQQNSFRFQRVLRPLSPVVYLYTVCYPGWVKVVAT